MTTEELLCRRCQTLLTGRKTVWCSMKCYEKTKYLSDVDLVKNRAIQWQKDNPEKARIQKKKALIKFRKNKPEVFNKLMNKQYHRNKDKWNSRTRTRNVIFGLNGYKKTELPVDLFCKECGIDKNLEILFEIYPNTIERIEKAIVRNQIYLLCHKHHRNMINNRKT